MDEENSWPKEFLSALGAWTDEIERPPQEPLLSFGDDELWEAWEREIECRVKEMNAGSAEMIPWSEVRRYLSRIERR